MLHDPTQTLDIDIIIDFKRRSENAVKILVCDCECCVTGGDLGLHRRDVQPLGLLFSPLLVSRVSPRCPLSGPFCPEGGLLCLPLRRCFGSHRLSLWLLASLRIHLYLPVDFGKDSKLSGHDHISFR